MRRSGDGRGGGGGCAGRDWLYGQERGRRRRGSCRRQCGRGDQGCGRRWWQRSGRDGPGRLGGECGQRRYFGLGGERRNGGGGGVRGGGAERGGGGGAGGGARPRGDRRPLSAPPTTA